MMGLVVIGAILSIVSAAEEDEKASRENLEIVHSLENQISHEELIEMI